MLNTFNLISFAGKIQEIKLLIKKVALEDESSDYFVTASLERLASTSKKFQIFVLPSKSFDRHFLYIGITSGSCLYHWLGILHLEVNSNILVAISKEV